jgi:hypothetical protein
MAEQTYDPGAYDAHVQILVGGVSIRTTNCRLDLDRPKPESVLRSYMVDLALKGEKVEDLKVLEFRVTRRH